METTKKSKKRNMKMSNWSVEKIQCFYSYLNEYFGLSVNPEIKLCEKNRFPVQLDAGKILFVQDFFQR